MEHYVTLFDSLFLPQGLALHLSMQRHAGQHTLWILCVDEETHQVLEKLALPNVRLLSLSSLETPELLQVKPGRTRGEYCWTLTPFAPRFVFEADPSIERVTYLDADLWFRAPPAAIFRELESTGKSVLITDHAYAAEYDRSVESGFYCVQFMTFTRHGGESARKWWEDRCIEWCFCRVEDGKFGDQRYLDDWPTRFADTVHVLQNKELVMAPWSAQRFPHAHSVVWHFHSLRLVSERRLSPALPYYRLPNSVLANVYLPYKRDLKSALGRLKSAGWEFRSQLKPFSLAYLIRMVQGYYQLLRRIQLRYATNRL